MERSTIQKIIELTAYGDDDNIWGMDTYLGTMDELIDEALDIIKNERQRTFSSKSRTITKKNNG